MVKLLTAKVFHKRLFPKVNHFSYGVFYLAFQLPFKESLNSRFMSIKTSDYGPRDGSCLYIWAQNHLKANKIDADKITLITMPRLYGFGFNPVSFYLCKKENTLKAVLAEVHNTFGEVHSYLCFKQDKSEILKDDTLQAEKLFHVSPFIERNGHYDFNFEQNDDKFSANITYYDDANNKQLLTSLLGNYSPASRENLNKALLNHPLVTLKVVMLIHYQALKLFLKGIKVIFKPSQLKTTFSISDKNHV